MSLTGICLALAGAFAIFQSATGHFLPHDTAFLGMAPEELCAVNECRVVHFMFHDRVSFGGVLIAIAILYLWITEFPLRERKAWAWWTLLASGITGFGSFLTYLGYGYLDTWHGIATLVLLPCFAVGLWKTRGTALNSTSDNNWLWLWPSALQPDGMAVIRTRAGVGVVFLLMSAIGTIGAGITIQLIGMTSVFVPTDLTFMGLSDADLDAINPRLIPLIAHDRAGFGGGLVTVGVLTLASVWFADSTPSFWQALLFAGLVGWTSAIGIHPIIGYTDFIHLAPAVAGAVLYFVGLALTRPAMYRGKPASQ